MPRIQLMDYEKAIRLQIAENLKNLSNGMTQVEISDKSGIPASTLSGYFNSTSTINPGNTQILADFFKVPKSSIDPRFKLNAAGKELILDEFSYLKSSLDLLKRKGYRSLKDIPKGDYDSLLDLVNSSIDDYLHNK